ncbi:MAG: IS66 family transposase [Nanoarchaeota archaeon]|nr:IS66 family transposase [Nanoarchaeota archaeon]
MMVTPKKYSVMDKEDLIKDVLKKDEIIEKKDKIIEELEKELKKYKNPHTPSSQKRFCKVEARGLKVGRKKGKKTGHKGRTRAEEELTDVIKVVTDENPNTGNKNIERTGYVEEVVITDFQIVKTVIRYDCYEYRDLDTGEVFIARHPDMPSKGIFGKNILAFTNFLRFKCRVPFDKISSVFNTVFNIPMTTPTAWNICNRVADKVSPYYDKLKVEIQEEKAVNSDETGAKKNGIPGWLWGFFSLTIALFVFNQRRGGDIVERVLGKDFKGVLGCDGWSTYYVFSQKAGILLQRCWAHAIRELKSICDGKDESLEKSYEWFCDIFEQVKDARAIKDQYVREQLYTELIGELNRWLQVYQSYKKLRPFVNKMENGENFWFTCVLHPEIEPTNNRAERGIRPWRILEKIIGCLRTDQGQRTTEIMMSLFSTWDPVV